MTEELKKALATFLSAAAHIQDHWQGNHTLQRQVLSCLRYPTVDEYRALAAAAADEVHS